MMKIRCTFVWFCGVNLYDGCDMWTGMSSNVAMDDG